MNAPAFEWIAGILLVLGGAISLIGALGLVRLRDFFQRMHPVALCSTLGCWCVSAAAVVVSTAEAGRPVVQAWLIPILLSITVPVTTVLLARAALFRRRAAGEPTPPSLSQSGQPAGLGRSDPSSAPR